MGDKEKDLIISKVARILGEEENRIKWDMSLENQIFRLVKEYEELEAFSLSNPDIEVIKEKNGIPTIIKTMDNRYSLQHPNQYKGGK